MPERRVGKFELLDELGHGGMGVVYRARDTRLDRFVALKFMRPDHAPDEASRNRFLRECRAVAALNHPNIATLYEADEVNGTLYFAAELVGGQTLAEVLDRGRVPLERALDLAGQLAQALAAAHAKGIIHRDIKPANLMITPDGRLKVLDFGIAHLAASREAAPPDAPTSTGAVSPAGGQETVGAAMGTPGYMAPELVRGEPVGPSADVFAAGVVLYELATGQRLFAGGEADERVRQVLAGDPPVAFNLDRRVFPALGAVIARCLHKTPAERYRDGAELRDALARTAAPPRKRWWWPAVAALLLVAVAVGLRWGRARPLAFVSQDRILIADVMNQTSEGAFGFSDALGTALEADLRQSQYAVVVGRREISEALQLTRRPPDTRLDLQTALDLARWVGAKAVLAPSITQVGETYRLAASLYATDSASPVGTASVRATSRDKLLEEAVDDLTAAIREQLGEPLAEIEQFNAPIVVVTTRSWEALEALRLGLKAADERRVPEAAAFFEEALSRDPEFAAAKGQLALVLIQFLNQPERGKRLLAEAGSSADRLSNYERVMFKGLVTQFVAGNLEAALEEFRVAAALFPTRSEPRRNQGMLLRALGRYHEAAAEFSEAHARDPKAVTTLELLWFLQVGPVRDPVGAEVTALKAAALRPGDPDHHHMVAWSYLAQQRYDEAAKEMAAIVAAHPSYSRARVNLAHLALRRGDAAGAAERYQSLLDDARAKRIDQDEVAIATWLATALQALARTAEADALFQSAARTARTPAMRAFYDAARGRRDASRRLLRALPETSKLQYQDALTAAAAYGLLGDREPALERLAHALRLSAWDGYYNLILPDFRPLWHDERFIRLVTTGK